jgi:glyoxylase-like metal-dependent hydrolase (beta-lactamase superfamily II)
MIVEMHAGGPFQENGYVIGCEDTREAVIVDPGDSVAELLEYATRANLSIRHILLTHAHIDHITGVAAARRATGAPVHLHRGDTFLYDDAAAMGAMFGMRVEAPPPVDEFYSAGTAIPFGHLEARAHHTPGHSPGGVCLEIGLVGRGGHDLFVGDTLFAGSIGRTDLPGGDYATLIASIRDVLFAFGDEARVHSGHGPATTIGRERRTNPFLVDAV